MVNLTVPPLDIKEGDTLRMKCVARLIPPTSGGRFSWRLNSKPLSNGDRVNIQSTYDPLGDLHVSELLLLDLSWKDVGNYLSYHLFMSLIFNQSKYFIPLCLKT